MNIDYKALGERIAKRRKVLNLTQEDVAEATGLSNNYISNIENNHSIPALIPCLRFAKQSIQLRIIFFWYIFAFGYGRRPAEQNKREAQTVQPEKTTPD